MNFRQLQMLQDAAPTLIRHLGAYAELAGQDIAATKVTLIGQAKAGVVVLIGSVFSLVSICLFVVAVSWDSPYRLLAIGIMGGVFITTTVIAAILMKGGKSVPAFASVKREWHQDKQILERLLGNKHASDGGADSHTESYAASPVDLDPLNKTSTHSPANDSLQSNSRPH